MCLGHESVEEPHLCGVAEQVIASLPWPCLVWPSSGNGPVTVNEAFQREFGLDGCRVGPRWLDTRLVAASDGDHVVHTAAGGHRRRYRLTRQVLDARPGHFDAVFLTPVADDAPGDGDAVATPAAGACLTPRESQVLDGIMEGKLNKVIAGELEISPKTVELHRANLMAKLHVHNVVELTRAVLDKKKAAPEGAAFSFSGG